MYLCTQNLKEMKIEQQIMAAAQAAVKALYGQDVPEKMVQTQKTRSEFEGNLTLVVFPFVNQQVQRGKGFSEPEHQRRGMA